MSGRYVYPDSYLNIIKEYLELKKKRCFTYEGLFYFVSKHRFYKDIKKTTLERVVRRLVSEGYLKRVKERPTAVFCLD